MDKEKLNKYLKNEVEKGEKSGYIMTFTDNKGNSKFIITAAYGPAHAHKMTHEKEINPGGVMSMCGISLTSEDKANFDKLLSESTVIELGYIKTNVIH